MSADPAIVNVPLAKRGNINAQLDAYKRTQAADRKALAKEQARKRDAYRKECTAILDGIPAERFVEMGRKAGLSGKQVEAHLRSKAYWEPAVYLPVLQREAAISKASPSLDGGRDD